MAPPIRTRPSFPLSQSFSSASFHKPLILIHQKADRMKTTITENEPNWSHGPQPCLTHWNYELCHVGPPKMDRSWWKVLTKHGPLEKGMAKHFSILALRTPWTTGKGKKIWYWKMNPPGWQVPNMLLEISEEITPERMKRLPGSSLGRIQGIPSGWEKTCETSLDRAKSVFYFLTTGFIPFLRTFSRYKMLTHDYTGLVLHHFVF